MSTVSKVHTFYKGLNKDLNTNNISNEHLTDALNATLMSDDTDQYTFNNEKGTSKICNLPVSTLIGRHVLEKETVLFFTGNGIHEVGVVENDVYVPYLVNNTVTGTVTTLNTETNTYSSWASTDNINFSVDNPIKIRWRKIFNNNRVIYFVDGLNTPKTINLDKLPEPTAINPTPSIIDAFNLFGARILPRIDYVEQLEYGNLEVGSYQFLVQYLDSNLSESLFSTATNPIPVVAPNRSSGRNNYIGTTRGTNAAKSIVLNVTGVDLDFKYLQLAVVRYTGIGDTVVAEVVDRKEITSDTIQFVYSDVSKSLKTIDLTSLADTSPGYVTANCIQDKDNVLTLGDLKSLPVQNLQSLVNKLSLKYRVKEVPYEDVVKTSRQVGKTRQNTFEIQDINVVNTLVDTINIVMTKRVKLPSVNDVALIKVVVTDSGSPAIADTVTYTRITPSSIAVAGKVIKATFSGSDFTDTSLFNFDDLTILNTTDPNHVPMYFIALGDQTAVPAGGVVGNPIENIYGSGYSYLSRLYTGQSTFTTMSSGDPSTVTLSTGLSNISLGDEVAIYGKTHTTETHGLYLVTGVTSGTIFDVDVTTGVADAVGGPVFSEEDIFGVDIIDELDVSTITPVNFLTNDSYFDDYVDEKMSADFKSRKRGEAYSFSIRFRFDNGGVTPFFHIPGNNRSSVYDSTTPDNNRLSAIPDIPTVDGRKNNSTGMLGTYISNAKYSSLTGHPIDSGSGSDYSNGSNVRHHIMPTLNDEPLLRFDEDTEQYYLRILGVFPLFNDNGFEKTIDELIQQYSSEFKGIVGYEFGVESRKDPGNKSIICQGIAQPMQFLYNTFKGVKASNSGFAGRTKVYTGTRTRALMDYDGTDLWHQDETYNQSIPFLCQFYSPDVLLLNTNIPKGAKIKPVAAIRGDVSTVSYQTPIPAVKLSQSRSGLMHMFYNYNDYYQDYDVKNVVVDLSGDTLLGGLLGCRKTNPSFVEAPTISNAYKLPGTGDLNAVFTLPSYPSLPIWNYMNEGYVCLDLGKDNSLPLLRQSNQFDFQITIQNSKSPTPYNVEYSVSDNDDYENNYYHDNQNNRLIYDIVLDVDAQYGDISESKYVVCGIFNIGQSTDFVSSTFYDGDVFLSKCSFRNSIGFPTEFKYKKLKYTKLANARSIGVDYTVGEEWNSLFYCWFESEVNCNYRYIGATASGIALQSEFPANPILSEFVQDANSVSRPIIPINTGAKTPATRGGVLDMPFNATESKQYNSLHSAEDIINVGFGLPLAFEDVTEFPNRIIYSTVAVEGEQQDSYKKFLANNYHDIPKDKGRIEIDRKSTRLNSSH